MNHGMKNLKQSGIRSSTIRCNELGGVNLGQGVCDLPTPDPIKLAAIQAINENFNTYAPYNGVNELRKEIFLKVKSFNKINLDSKEQILVSAGSTGGYISAVKALLNPGDEVLIFEPFYGYHKQILDLHNIVLKPVPLDFDTQYSFNIDYMESLITDKTKLIILCNPSNPTGKVFTETELKLIGDLANKYNLFIISDEIYEYITYSPNKHISIASLEDYNDRVITLFGLSKTYHMTGWRIGYAVGPKEIIKRIGLIHDLIYICAPTPLQYAGVAALQQSSDYYENLKNDFLMKRDFVVNSLNKLGFKVAIPQGAYYLIADYSHLKLPSDSSDATVELLEKAKVATVPAKYFYLNEELAQNKLRFCFALSQEKLRKGMHQIESYFSPCVLT